MTNSLPFRSNGTLEVAYLISNVSSLCSPEPELDFTCFLSGHLPSREKNFPATILLERAGPVADPMSQYRRYQ